MLSSVSIFESGNRIGERRGAATGKATALDFGPTWPEVAELVQKQGKENRNPVDGCNISLNASM